MLVVLGGIFLLHIAAIVILLVATIDNAWWVVPDQMSTDIWARWVNTNGVWNYTNLPTSSNYPSDYLQAVQATSVLACVFCCISLLVFIAQLFTLPKGQKFIVSGVLQFLACLFIMIAASIYTDRFHIDESNGTHGYCYILAWVAFGLTFLSAIIYVVLRKK